MPDWVLHLGEVPDHRGREGRCPELWGLPPTDFLRECQSVARSKWVRMSMGGSEETRSIVYLDYWGGEAGRRWRSTRSDLASVHIAPLLRRSRKGPACFASAI